MLLLLLAVGLVLSIWTLWIETCTYAPHFFSPSITSTFLLDGGNFRSWAVGISSPTESSIHPVRLDSINPMANSLHIILNYTDIDLIQIDERMVGKR